MDPYTVKRIDDMEASFLGSFKRARAELGVTAFGMQVIDIPAGNDLYPEHDHAEDGQEEVYWAVSGEGKIEVAGDTHPLTPENMVRVGPGVMRKVRTGDSPMRLLVVGGVPGGVYEPSANGKLGAPDPMAQAQS
jgi:mannose-6-phosphate isomerase-like protein (cupin superfamily)